MAENKRLLWELWRRSKALSKQPSDLIGIRDPVKRFYVDRAIWMFGTQIENEMDEAGSKTKDSRQGQAARTAVLNKYLNPGLAVGQFRDPAKQIATGSGSSFAGGESFLARSRSRNSAR